MEMQPVALMLKKKGSDEVREGTDRGEKGPFERVV